MQILKSFFITFSLYSNIPVPQFAWKEEDMKYVFCFFPWVGALIACCLYAWMNLCFHYQIGTLCRTLSGASIPLLITGGVHLDGFMDTMDALHSYRPKEQKLQILQDSHIGAFAVIMLAVYGMICLGALSEIERTQVHKIICSGFFLSRCLCGISALSFPLAKQDGLLYLFVNSSHKRIVKFSLYLQSVICIGLMFYWQPFAGLIIAGTAICTLIYYFYRSRKEFGGVTGDTAGCFVVLCEGCMIVAASVVEIFVEF